MSDRPQALLEVTDLSVSFDTPGGEVRAARHVSFAIEDGETVALVGESGSGKSVTALSVLQLLPRPPARYVSGRIRFRGEELMGAPESALRAVRGNRIALVPQEPMTSLNPLHVIERQVSEVLLVHKKLDRAAARARTLELLHLVGLPEAERRLNAYPHQLSGGQRQRVMIAMALAMDPKVLIADEPTTALDVTVQAQIMDLLAELRRDLNMGMILITHDLGVVADVADRIAVMYAGRIVEHADVHSLYRNPAHPYSKGLLESIPRLDDKGTALATIKGLPPNLMRPPSGCAFHPRCKYAQEICVTTTPPLLELGNGRTSACHFAKELLDGRI